MKQRKIYAALFLLALAGGLVFYHSQQRPEPRWDQQVYIWQRVWTPQHEDALSASRDPFSTLRVLGLQIHPQDKYCDISINTALLRKDGRPLWLVVRIDGRLTHLDRTLIFEQLRRTLQRWQAAGLQIVGVEIDHDAATAHLSDYRQFLSELRQQLPKKLLLSITTLPAWISSPDLPGLLTTVNTSVLQVHAVNSPERGLFDGPQSLRWVRQYARISATPFHVALPAYGMGLLVSDAQGPRVESETSLRTVGTIRELNVAPATIEDFTHKLSQQAPKNLRGLIWFRLPLAGDRRAWSMSTLRAVIKHQPLTTRWSVVFSSQSDGLYDLRVRNDGDIDALLPHEIDIQAEDCLSADAVGHYRLVSGSAQQRFIRNEQVQIRAGQSRPLGWLRCKNIMQGSTNVIP